MPKKMIVGQVISDKMQNTIVISVDTWKKHKMYKKNVKETRKFKAHDDMGVKIGDIVRIEECPPYSKTVSWIVVEKLTEGAAK